jgi:NADPH2:quinone reductase
MNVRLMCVLVYTTPQHLLQKAATEIGVTLAEAALRPLPTLHFPLAEIADVHEAVEQGAVGKIVVDLPAVVPRAV